MGHEKSESTERDGKFVNVYGRTTPKAGQQLPRTPTYTTLDAAVSAAQLRSDIEGWVEQASKRYGVPAPLIHAIIDTESQGVPGAIGQPTPHGQARGLMQVMPKFHGFQGKEKDLLDPQTNIDVGTRHLAYLLKRFGGDTDKAIAAYNTGEGNLQKMIDARGARWREGLPKGGETQAYLSSVKAAYAAQVAERSGQAPAQTAAAAPGRPQMATAQTPPPAAADSLNPMTERKGLLGLRRSAASAEVGGGAIPLARVINFLGNDLLFFGQPPQTVAGLAGNLGMAAGMAMVPLAGPALARGGYVGLARAMSKLPPAIQRILAGALTDEISRDIVIGGARLGNVNHLHLPEISAPGVHIPGGSVPLTGEGEGFGTGLKTGGGAAAIGEAVIPAGKLAGKGAGLAKRLAETGVKKIPGVGHVVKQYSIQKGLAEAADAAARREHEAILRAQYNIHRRAYEGAERAREAQYQGAVAEHETNVAAAAKETTKRQTAAADVTIQRQLAQAARAKAEAVGGVIGKVSPPLAFKTAGQAAEMASLRGNYKKELGKYWEETLKQAEGMLPQGATIRVPALARLTPEDAAAKAQAEGLFRQQLGLGPEESLPTAVQGQLNKMFPAKDRFTLREFAEELKNHQAGYRGAGAFSDTRTRMGLDARKQYSQALQQAEEEVRSHPGGDAAWQAFNEGRTAFSVGEMVLKHVFTHEKMWARGPEEVLISEKGLQDAIRKNAQKFEDRMPAEDWKALKNIVFGGEDITVANAPKAGQAGLIPRTNVAPVIPATTLPGRSPGPWLPKPEMPAFMQETLPGQVPLVTAGEGRGYPFPFSWKHWAQTAFDAAIERGMSPGPARTLSLELAPATQGNPPLPENTPAPPQAPVPPEAAPTANPPLPED